MNLPLHIIVIKVHSKYELSELVVKNPLANVGDERDAGLIPV